MIDKNGNKIIKNESSEDKNFLLAEIKFLTKGFRKESNDKKALNIAKSIHKFLKVGGEVSDIAEILEELESYSTESNSDTFVWELVYVRRLIGNHLEDEGDTLAAAENRLLAAKHFEKICEIEPTLHNRCVRVTSYVNAAVSFKKAGEISMVTSVFGLAFNAFKQIEECDEAKYYSAGEFLYTKMYVHNAIDARDKFHYIQKAARYSFQYCKIEKNYESVDYLALLYKVYLGYGQFPLVEERENLKTLFGWLKEDPKLAKSNEVVIEKIRKVLRMLDSDFE